MDIQCFINSQFPSNMHANKQIMRIGAKNNVFIIFYLVILCF